MADKKRQPTPQPAQPRTQQPHPSRDSVKGGQHNVMPRDPATAPPAPPPRKK